MEVATRTVWQSAAPLSPADLHRLDLPDGIVPVGIGRGVMDAHYFRQSPGAKEPGPVRDRFIDGHRFIHCANPSAEGPQQPIPQGPFRLMVDKHHSLVFEAGRDLLILKTQTGANLVQVISPSPEGGGLLQTEPVSTEAFRLPAGWHLRTAHVTERTVIDLPNPTEAWFFADGSSFQGSVPFEL